MSKKRVQWALNGVVHAGWVATAFISAGLTVGLVLRYLANDQFVFWLESPLGSLALSAVIYVVAAVLVVVPFLVNRTSWKGILDKLSISRRLRGKMVVWSLYAWILYFISSTMATLVLVLVRIPGVNLEQGQQIGFQNLTNSFEYVAAFIALVVIAPIFEEIVFRGYLFGRIREKNGYWLSAILTSLTFALLHGQVNVGIDVFILSMFLCYLREKFDSIWPGVMVHALKNGLAYTVIFILPLLGVKLLQ